MDITYKPFFRDTVFSDFSIKSPVIPITGYKPKYIEKSEKKTEPPAPIEPTQVTKVSESPQLINLPSSNKSADNTKFTSKQMFKDTMTSIYTAALIKRGINPAFAKALVAQDGHESA